MVSSIVLLMFFCLVLLISITKGQKSHSPLDILNWPWQRKKFCSACASQPSVHLCHRSGNWLRFLRKAIFLAQLILSGFGVHPLGVSSSLRELEAA